MKTLRMLGTNLLFFGKANCERKREGGANKSETWEMSAQKDRNRYSAGNRNPRQWFLGEHKTPRERRFYITGKAKLTFRKAKLTFRKAVLTFKIWVVCKCWTGGDDGRLEGTNGLRYHRFLGIMTQIGLITIGRAVARSSVSLRRSDRGDRSRAKDGRCFERLG